MPHGPFVHFPCAPVPGEYQLCSGWPVQKEVSAPEDQCGAEGGVVKMEGGTVDERTDLSALENCGSILGCWVPGQIQLFSWRWTRASYQRSSETEIILRKRRSET